MDDFDKGTFEFILIGLIGTLLVLFGLVGNSISIAVFSMPNMRSSINCILRCLAFFDVVVLVCWYLEFGWVALMIKFKETFVVSDLTPLGLRIILLKIGYCGSVWSTVGATIERYVAICHPFRAKSICTYTRAQIWNVLAVVYIAFINVPDIITFATLDPLERRRNENATEEIESQKAKVGEVSSLVEPWVQISLLHIVPLIIFFVLNASVIRTFITTKKVRKYLARGNKRKNNLVSMLLCVVTVTILSSIFQLGFHLKSALTSYFSFGYPLYSFKKIMITVNSSVNFFIYCLTCAKFRKAVLKMSRKYCVSVTGKKPEGRQLSDVELVGDRRITLSSGLQPRSTYTRRTLM